MGKVLTADLRPGMKTEADVFNEDDKLVIPGGTVLTDRLITRLEFHGIPLVDIIDEESEASGEGAAEDSGEALSYFSNIRKTPEFKAYKQNFDKQTGDFKDKCNSIVSENVPIDTDEMLGMVGGLLDLAQKKCSVYDMLHSMRDYDDESFAHSINVALISNVFGHWLKLSEDEIDLLTLCGLFHDIGKTKVPKHILRKSGRLTDSERRVIQQHSVDGYRILQRQNINNHIKNAALMHHERFDGSGYPLGLKGDQIDTYAAIVAIADVYDAITSPRVYRAALCPFKAIEIFEDEGLQKYDAKYIMTFLRNVVYTYVQRPVRLSNGDEVTILEVNASAYSRPLVQSGNTFIDLKKHPELHIMEIL